MTRFLATVAAGAVAVSVAVAARQAQTPPVFRGGTNLVQLDVSVLDRDYTPVTGLTAADFTLLENGKPQTIVAFAAVNVPPPTPPTAAWMQDVAPDVLSNQLRDSRIVVLVVDDAGGGSVAGVSSGRRTAEALIDSLGPDDRMAVVYAFGNTTAQDFTGDRVRLRRALGGIGAEKESTAVILLNGLNVESGQCTCRLCSIEVLERVAQSLKGIQDRRKVVVFLSTGVAIVPGDILCESAQRVALNRVFREAQLANVSIYPVDPSGLKTKGGRGGEDREQDFLLTLAGYTGGHAVVNDNYPERVAPRIMVETGSYYLLGYEPSSLDPKGDEYRRLDVKVNRPGVEVHTRSRYYNPPAKVTEAAAEAPPLESAIAGALSRRDLPMRLAVAPFASAAPSGSTVVFTIGLDAPPTAPGTTDAVDVLTRAFTPDGTPRGSTERTARIAPPSGAAEATFEVFSRMDLGPGRYELRVSAHHQRIDKTGSVYVSIDVPDFSRLPLSVSGVVMRTRPAPPAALGNLLATLLPATVTPTARREFTRADRVTAFARVYQGGRPAVVPVSMLFTITDEHNAPVRSFTDALPPDDFAARRFVNYERDLPVADLAPGRYLMTIQAMVSDEAPIRRDVRFSVK